jgi:serine/threonine protein kinase
LSERGVPKLIDFGLAKQIFSGKTFTMCGTPDYLAPEVILNQGHNHAVDYWTLGIFISELVAGQSPFAADSSMEIYRRVLNTSPKLSPLLSRSVSDLILRLLKTEQATRLGNMKEGIGGIICHKWFDSFNWKKLENCELSPPYVPNKKNKDDFSNFELFMDNEATPVSLQVFT